MSSSSDESDASAPRRSVRLSADRGVISRASYAVASESSSDSETEVDEGDESDDLPLAQREEAAKSDEETEDEETEDELAGVHHEQSTDGGGHVKTESVGDGKQGDSSGGDESETDDGEEQVDGDDDDDDSDAATEDEQAKEEEDSVSIKSEQEEEQTMSEKDEDDEDEETEDDESEYVESDAEEIKAEKDDAAVAVTRAKRGAGRPNADRIADYEDEHTAVRAQGNGSRAEASAGEETEEETAEREDVEEEEDDEGKTDERNAVSRGEVDEAKRLLEHVVHIHLPFLERVALHKRKVVSGPPMDRAISQADQWKRKYRWPVAMRNVRRRQFIANAEELASDHQVLLTQPTPSVSATAQSAFAAALAPTARPLMEAAVAKFREQNETRQQRMNFVDSLEEAETNDPDAVDATRLRATARLGGDFTDQLLDSILVKNVLALQGLDASYAQQCWDPLPTSKRPVANWRFVLEHFCRTLMHGVDAMALNSAPRLRKDTLMRIRDRLRALYGVAWRPEDDAFFDRVDQQEIDPPDPSELIRL